MRDYAYDLANAICEFASLNGLESLDRDLALEIYCAYIAHENWRTAVLAGCQAVLKLWGTKFLSEKTLLTGAFEAMAVEGI
ncbi:hypothetical protein [Corynebacterium pseudodiphtheriticum]|uniref:hypothetical protein n=1 Tax=Corynebacterium pseudodiphtheriticum TaxID=37637 RepID=UPI002542BE5C|nr:hypothetical protein [Corynebacterium pseudodiphtheriticum]